MQCTARGLIEIRKKLWGDNKSIKKDVEFRMAVASELVENRDLLSEIVDKPEYLIELIFVIVDKEKKTLPFFLNKVQLSFIQKLNETIEGYKSRERSNISLLILKGRQQGFTSLITAYQLSCCILRTNFEGFTVADASDNAESIFENKAKFPYYQIPEVLKPTEQYNNRRLLRFDKLNSSWGVEAATKQLGRSRTINFLHGSECAFWPYGIAITQASLGEALTKDSIRIYESTPNGFNDYKDMWDSGQHVNCFYAWWDTDEYRFPFLTKKVQEDFILEIYSKKGSWIYDRLIFLREEIGLDDNQLLWYFQKYEGYLDKEVIKQEYPCFPEEAFISSGQCAFDTNKIITRLNQIKEPLARGSFVYKYDGLKISDIQWMDDINGAIKIYQQPKLGVPYVLGGDTAGEGSDFFTGQMTNNTNAVQVATLHGKFDEDIYAHQMYCLGMYYNSALIAIEANFSTYPIKELERLEYPRQYVRRSEDIYEYQHKKSHGVKTTTLTRPLMISSLIALVRDNIECLNDKETLEEMLMFIKNKVGKYEAQLGAHDDLVMGLGVNLYARDQQSMVAEKMAKDRIRWTSDMYHDYENASSEQKGYLIKKWGNPF